MSTSLSDSATVEALRLARLCLRIILVAGLAGSAFSGSLAFRELVGAGASCPATSTTIAGVPVCVYGFAMFVFVTVVAAWGLLGQARAATPVSAPRV